MLEKAAFYSQGLYENKRGKGENSTQSPAESPEMLGLCNKQDWKKSDHKVNIISTKFGILGSSPPESGEGSLQYVQRWICL